jgi:hypothetical protein
MTEILNDQLADPFRIVLLIGLYITMLRTRTATGTFMPLAAGAVAVSLIIATTLSSGVAFGPNVGMGIVANIILLAIIHGAYQVFLRVTRK